MVVSNYPKGARIFKQVGGLLATFFILSIAAVLIDRHGHLLRIITIPEMVVGVLGAALSILLAFRTNSAYARWWEARILWGSLVNQSRSLARQAISFSRVPASEAHAESAARFAKTFVYSQIAFVHALRCSLRRQPPIEELRPFLDDASLKSLEAAQNVPNAILMQLGLQLSASFDGRFVDGWQMHRLDQTLSELSNIMGGCERIKNTPLPRQYDFYPELLIKLYCLVLPFIIVDEVGLFTPWITLLVAFAFLALNRIGKNLEDPFENRVYDVPMTALSRTIEINLRQALGETSLPPAMTPVNGVLM